MKVLIAEDEMLTRHVLEANLRRWGYEVVAARDGNQAREALCSDPSIRLAIVDWMMPGVQGPDLCRELRERGVSPYVYVLLLTSRQGPQDLVQGLLAGADDFLRKPFDAAELEARLRTGRRLVSLEETLRLQATTDPLTGTLNRGAVLEMLRLGHARSRQDGQPLSVILADLDRFKSVNDTYGHAGGDAVLVEAVRRMRESVRAGEILGRWGGEEFLIGLPGVAHDDALKVAERLRVAVGGSVIAIPGHTLAMTVSLGVASFSDAEERDLEALIGAADQALYRAKAEGRNQVRGANVARCDRSLIAA